MSNTSVRIIVGIIGIPLVVTLAVIGNTPFLIFCVAVSFFCMNEFYNLFENTGKGKSLITGWIGGFSFHKAVFLVISSLIVICLYHQLFNYVLILYFLMFLYLTADEIFKTNKHFEAIGSWMLSVVYISTPFGLLAMMDTAEFIKANGANYPIIIMILVWVTDTFAYFGGKTFGKHKLAERVSPKKTWEGSIIGFTFTVIAGLIIQIFYIHTHSIIFFTALAVIAGISAQLGDLFESHLKRSVAIKDSSNLIPGHGGFLDRFDSILFAVPAVYIFIYLVATL